MEGTPQLLTDVKFTQLRKGGYDPEEVDNYLERINDAVAKLAENLRAATERAETAQSQLADARRAQEEAESELNRIRGGGMVSSAPAADEEVAKVLVLAQRAADQAVEEANETATKTVADARAKAVNLLADAEQERERLLVKAHKKADAVAEERARTLNDQVAALSSAKADLETDVAALTTHLELERDRLREAVESVRAALDDPEGLRLAPTPELLDTPIPQVDLPTPSERPSPFAPVEPDTTETPEVDLDTGSAALVDDDAVVASGIDDGSSVLDPTDAAAAGEADLDLDENAAPPADAESDLGVDEAGSPTDADAGTDESDEPADAEASDVRLFETGAASDPELDSGSPTELFTPDDHPLGPPDKEADEAMRAFFERDLDDPEVSTSRGRFGRRR
jgi:DivIVA domain-containing protein